VIGPAAFGYILVVCAAGLALWILARYSSLAPRTILWAAAHVVVACVLLRLLPLFFSGIQATGVPGALYLKIFGAALPLLVYAFLSGGWMAKLAVGLLRP
jgi:hypothetical protein